MAKRYALALAMCASALTLTFVCAAPAAAPTPPPACKGGTGCSGSACPAGITATSSTLPTAACPFEGESQSAVDVFSWNEFVALNWPATQSCTADTTKSIVNVKTYKDGPVVWQTQMSADDVFKASPATPAPWCGGASVAALFAHEPVPFAHIAKAAPAAHLLGGMFASIAEPTGVTAVGGVVTDQSGRWLRYDRYMNQTEYNTVVPKNWWQLAVLNKLPSITLPSNSLELKSSWKVLTPAEIAGGRYYTTMATVYNTPDEKKSPGHNPVTLGLVGLHIIQKTAAQKGFFWSTFEQVDNDKVFYRLGNPAPINKQTAKKPYVELNPNGTPHNLPVQIKRVNKIPVDPGVNAYYQQLLKGSVFANYRLISTQWQTGGAPQGTPANVANITIETYVQSVSTPPSTAPKAMPRRTGAPFTGCLGCHAYATTANKKTATDHSFLFLEAK